MSNEAIKRARLMLEVAAKYIMNHCADQIIIYDDAECDGYCVADDCQSASVDLAATRATGWQPIETAPKDGTLFLALSNKGVMFIGFWQGVMTDTAVSDANMPKWRSCTHWMPLPEAPK